MHPLLHFENVHFRHPAYAGMDSSALLTDCSFCVNAGEFHLILGVPETGKTTLLRLFSALLPRHGGGDIKGRRELAGVSLEGADPAKLLDRVGCVFQNPDEQIVSSRCDAEVAFSLESMGMERAEMLKRVPQALEAFGLKGFDARDPMTLSGGEKRRLLLAALYAQDPALWLLDETLDEIDPASRLDLLARLKGLTRERKTSIVLFASKLKQAYAESADFVHVLSQGALLSRTADECHDFALP